MGRLDEVDLSLSLGRKEEEASWSAQGAAGAVAADARRADRRAHGSGRRCSSSSRAGTRPARAARSSGWWRRWTRATSGSPSSPRRARTRSATTSSGASGRRCRAGAGWPSSTAPGTGACWSSGSRASPAEEQWRRAYDEIDAFERTLADEGAIVVKLWLHISPEEQLQRFEARAEDPLKSWKLTDEDWRNREKRGALRGGGRGDAGADRPAVRAAGA